MKSRFSADALDALQQMIRAMRTTVLAHDDYPSETFPDVITAHIVHDTGEDLVMISCGRDPSYPDPKAKRVLLLKADAARAVELLNSEAARQEAIEMAVKTAILAVED